MKAQDQAIPTITKMTPDKKTQSFILELSNGQKITVSMAELEKTGGKIDLKVFKSGEVTKTEFNQKEQEIIDQKGKIANLSDETLSSGVITSCTYTKLNDEDKVLIGDQPSSNNDAE